jgi:hypothetical protein
MPIDASFAVNGTEWQIGPVGTVAGAMPAPSPTRMTAESIAEKDHERVAQQIRTWMQED